jgi:hypothetical protein
LASSWRSPTGICSCGGSTRRKRARHRLVDQRSACRCRALSARSASERAQLALRWAPIHDMDVDPSGSHALSGRSDFITRIAFDGDFNARNNWENAASAGASFAAHAYSNDGPARGELATDPAKRVLDYFTIPGGFSRSYTFNPCR